jgi:hypothetical protein
MIRIRQGEKEYDLGYQPDVSGPSRRVLQEPFVFRNPFITMYDRRAIVRNAEMMITNVQKIP